MVDVLLAAGADTFCVDENGNSALHLACFYGNREVVRLLLTVDCDVTVSGLSLVCLRFGGGWFWSSLEPIEMYPMTPQHPNILFFSHLRHIHDGIT